ncbi:hypothetical protein [Mediterraneibacter sp.]|jgi:hypothetical protein|uniref:hypothetical protein n=1 Tax=Mediterraneibacter sp. TaxID=2316022 RepID=UPI0027B9686E|nr:hypothetical protein [Mediterraneibacter sp.]
MKNKNQHFLAGRRKLSRCFWIKAAVIGGFSAAVVFAAAAAVYRNNRFDLKVGKEKVEKKEYQLCMELVKYDTKMEIQKRYDAPYGEDFWEQSYEGKYGYEILADNTIEKIKYIHAVYDLAEEYGDVSDGSFAAVEKRWEKENAKRKKKIEAGEVVYGLKEYTFARYMQYEISMYKEIYCNDTDRKEMALTEEEIAEYYSQGEWIFQDSEDKADLETARVAVERELREKKYDVMIAQMAENSKVSGNLEATDRFTLKLIK